MFVLKIGKYEYFDRDLGEIVGIVGDIAEGLNDGESLDFTISRQESEEEKKEEVSA